MPDEIILYKLICDSAGKGMSGEKKYRMHLPETMPSCKFWSVIVYDNKTGQMIVTAQSWPSVYSSCKKLLVNQDGSVDIWFGPIAPPGKESNWIKTTPGEEWKMILRLYEPLESEVNMKWKPGEIELL